MTVATERFRALAEATRRSRGVPEAPCIVLPVTEETEYGSKEIMDRVADQALAEILTIVAPGVRPVRRA